MSGIPVCRLTNNWTVLNIVPHISFILVYDALCTEVPV